MMDYLRFGPKQLKWRKRDFDRQGHEGEEGGEREKEGSKVLGEVQAGGLG